MSPEERLKAYATLKVRSAQVFYRHSYQGLCASLKFRLFGALSSRDTDTRERRVACNV